jgi:hypothetical protein
LKRLAALTKVYNCPMKKLYLASVFAVFLFGFWGTSNAATMFEILEEKDSYYQKERIQIDLHLDTPHTFTKAEYFIVNAETGKKAKLGKVKLESMYVGFNAGLIIEQKPGKYYYLTVLHDGSDREEYETDTITILSSKKTPKVEIDNFDVTFTRIPYNEQTTEQEYALSLLSESSVQLSDVWGTVRMKCTKPVMLYEKGGSIKCSKKFSTILKMSGNTLDYRFHVDEDDLERDVKLVLEYTLTNFFGKKLDKENMTTTLSSEI